MAYALFRVALGLDMLMHGVSRLLVGPTAFAGSLVRDFQATILPPALVQPFGTVLPFAELALGVLLVAGLATRWALMAGVALMCALMLGTSLQGKWDVVTQQLLYAAAFSGLLAGARWDRYSLDRARWHGRCLSRSRR